MELKDYKEIIIDGVIMKTLSVNGEEIWKGNPDDLYLIKDGKNMTGKSWSKSGSYTTIDWDYSKTLRIRTETGPRATHAWTVTCPIKVDVTDFTKLHVAISSSQSSYSGATVYSRSYIGDNLLSLGNGVSKKTERVLDITDLTGEMTFKITGSNYGDSATSQTYHSTNINDVWFTAE